MCARYSLHQSNALIADLFDLQWEPELQPRYNIAPTTQVPAVIEKDGKRELDFFKWGLVPSWAKDPSVGVKMINARSETASEKPSFRSAFKHRRCLIVADGFFEWHTENGKKQPYYLSMKDGKPFAFAGLWETWRPVDDNDQELRTCTILTCGPNTLLKPIHDRMPVILPPESYDTWLDPEFDQIDALNALMVPFDAATMQMYPVTTKVGNPRYDSAENVVPVKSS